MKRLVLSIIYIFLLPVACYALTIAHPTKQQMCVTDSGIFFAGKIEKDEQVFINNIKMCPEETGAFSHSFSLEKGVNNFEVRCLKEGAEAEITNYSLTRVSLPKSPNKVFVPQESSYYTVNTDNTILRSSPVDAGMNRLGYLPCGTKVVSDGISGGFSRIYLSKNNYGWISTRNLSKSDETEFCFTPNCLLKTEEQRTKTGSLYEYYLSDNVPYSVISDGQTLKLTLYNISTDNEKYIQEFELDRFPRYSSDMKNGILKICFKENPVKTRILNKHINIVIDAGHGGKEMGAVGCLGDKEKDINLEVALKLKELLKQHKYNVSMTREADEFISLNDRVSCAKSKDAMIFISIHLNSVPYSVDPNTKSGCGVYYYNPQCKKLAEEVSKEIAEGLSLTDGGAIQASYAVIRPTEYIGILVELAYMVNPKDVSVYKSEEFLEHSAEAIYRGLVNYINSK